MAPSIFFTIRGERECGNVCAEFYECSKYVPKIIRITN